MLETCFFGFELPKCNSLQFVYVHNVVLVNLSVAGFVSNRNYDTVPSSVRVETS